MCHVVPTMTSSFRPPLSSGVSASVIVPQPNARGISRVQELYLRRTGKSLSDDDAHRLLAAAIRWVWAVHRPPD